MICESHPTPPCLTRRNHLAAIRVDPLNIPSAPPAGPAGAKKYDLSLTLSHRAWAYSTTRGGPHEQKIVICEIHYSTICAAFRAGPTSFTLTPLNH